MAEPLPAEPLPSEPLPSEPLSSEPLPAEPVPSEPQPAEPLPAEPQPAEPLPAAEPVVAMEGEDILGENVDQPADIETAVVALAEIPGTVAKPIVESVVETVPAEIIIEPSLPAEETVPVNIDLPNECVSKTVSETAELVPAGSMLADNSFVTELTPIESVAVETPATTAQTVESSPETPVDTVFVSAEVSQAVVAEITETFCAETVSEVQSETVADPVETTVSDIVSAETVHELVSETEALLAEPAITKPVAVVAPQISAFETVSEPDTIPAEHTPVETVTEVVETVTVAEVVKTVTEVEKAAGSEILPPETIIESVCEPSPQAAELSPQIMPAEPTATETVEASPKTEVAEAESAAVESEPADATSTEVQYTFQHSKLACSTVVCNKVP